MTHAIEVSEAEVCMLITSADRENPLPLYFGGNRTFLATGQPGSLHALQVLAGLRGVRT